MSTMAVDITNDARALKSSNFFLKLTKSNSFAYKDKSNECFNAYDLDSDGRLKWEEFHQFLTHLLNKTNFDEKEATDKRRTIFLVFDKDKDGYISKKEFEYCWQNWVKKFLCPVSALLVVDVQNDFISGTLALSKCQAQHNAEEVVPIINELIDTVRFDAVVYTYDWHPPDHISFYENRHLRKIHSSSLVQADEAKVSDTVIFEDPEVTEQTLWPAHCIQNEEGAQLHKELKVIAEGIHVYKGTNPNIDSYSAFWDNNDKNKTTLQGELQKRQVNQVFVCGLAFDVCVGATAHHAIRLGLQTVLIEDASRGVHDREISKTRHKISDKGLVVSSQQVANIVSLKDRWLELGHTAAVNLTKHQHSS